MPAEHPVDSVLRAVAALGAAHQPSGDLADALRRGRARRRRRHAVVGAVTCFAAFAVAASALLALTRDRDEPVRFEQSGPGTTVASSIPPVVVGEPDRPEVPATTTTRSPNADSLVVPDGVALCTPADLDPQTGMGLFFLRFFNRDRQACGIAGYPTLAGISADGSVVPIPREPLDLAPTNGPRWTGVFEPDLVLVLSVRSNCVEGGVVAQYDRVRLYLPNGTGWLDLDAPIDVGTCPVQITHVAADSQDL